MSEGASKREEHPSPTHPQNYTRGEGTYITATEGRVKAFLNLYERAETLVSGKTWLRRSKCARNGWATYNVEQNSATVRPAERMRLRKVPLATVEWFGTERVTSSPGLVMMICPPRCRATLQPKR